MNAYTPVLASFWTSLIVSALAAWPIYRLLLALKSRQTVSQYAPEGHQLKQGTPTMGGLIIVAGVVASLGFQVVANKWTMTPGPGFILGALVLFVLFAGIGFLDDYVVPRLAEGKRGLGWKQKIVLQFVSAIIGIGLCNGFDVTVHNAVAVFLVLFLSNAYNFADGLDGLAGSLLLAMGLGLVWLGMLSGLGPLFAPLVATLLGAVIPFLFLNAPPAKVFMGDVGSLPIGALLGLTFFSLGSQSEVAEGSYLSASTVPSLLVLGLMMAAELLPVPLQIFWVKVFKKKLFPYTPIHHAFEKAGWPESRVVWTFALTQLLLSIAAVSLFVWMQAQAGYPRYYHYFFSPELGR